MTIRRASSASAAAARAEKLAGLVVTIKANCGDEGKLFGSIGTRDIAEAITAAGVEVQKSEVLLPNGVWPITLAWVPALAAATALLAAGVPAVAAYRTDVHTLLNPRS